MRTLVMGGWVALALVSMLAIARPALAAPSPPLAPGERMPALKGDLLSGGRFVMPDSAAGRTTLLLLGFSYASRFDVDKWVERFRAEFGREPHLTFYEVPVIGSAGRLGRPFIDGGMRSKRSIEMQRHVLMVYRDAGDWKRWMAHAAPDVAYVLLVGADGRVLWRGQGPFGEDSWRALAARLRATGPVTP